MNEIVYRGEGNQPLTNSKLVAEVFEKPHDNVLKAIRKILQGGIVKNDETPMLKKRPTSTSRTNRVILCSL